MMSNDYISDVYIPVPCKGCIPDTGRYPGCHSKCEKYISYRMEMDKKKEIVRQAKEDIYRPASIRRIKRARMKGAKHGEV